MKVLLLAVTAFLLGSFPSGYVLARIVTGRDIRRLGSGNIGASNVSSTAGRPVGIAVGVLDILKGLIAVLIGKAVGLAPRDLAMIALLAVLGHNFSIFLRFRGGKGVATSFGVMLALAPLAAIIAMLTWLVIALTVGYASVASLLALALAPIYLALAGADPAYVLCGIGLFLLATVKHWENLLRLAHGKETRITRPWSQQ